MSSAVLFGVYTTEFPFLDSGESKIRPVVVISQPQGKHHVVVVVPLSSQPQQADIDVIIDNWSDAGLMRPTVAQVHRLTTMLQANLRSELGVLSPQDTAQLRKSLHALLSN